MIKNFLRWMHRNGFLFSTDAYYHATGKIVWRTIIADLIFWMVLQTILFAAIYTLFI